MNSKKRKLNVSTSVSNSIYTSHHVIKKNVIKISKFILSFPEPNRPYFIDFSAGDDYLGESLREKGIIVISYDLVSKSDTVIIKDWFETDPYTFADNKEKSCVIGFNPPFGPGGKFARQFLEYAFLYKPLRVYCIMPKGPKYFRPYDYKAIETELLAPRHSFITKEGKSAGYRPGLYLRIFEREEGYWKGDHKKVPWPSGIISKYKTTGWDLPDTLFIRRNGYKPGEQILYNSGENHLILLRPNGEWIDRPTLKQINNSLGCYQNFQLSELGEWRFDIETCMEKIQDKARSFKLNRDAYHFPCFKKLYFVKLLNEILITNEALPMTHSRYKKRQKFLK